MIYVGKKLKFNGISGDFLDRLSPSLPRIRVSGHRIQSPAIPEFTRNS